MKLCIFLTIALVLGTAFGAGPNFAPYYDTTLKHPDLQDVQAKTGLKDYTLAFALGGIEGCVPSWGGQFPIDDPEILAPIHSMISQGGQMILATGGAAGPYLEHLCGTPEALVQAYKVALDAVGTNHLDIDIEANINLDLMNTALAQLQAERPDVTVSFTLMVQGEDYGVTLILGVDVLVSAKNHGVRVDIVNAMCMEYPKLISTPTWGESIVNAANSTLYQMKEIWPEKPDSELRSMLGITPMLGRNFNGNMFTQQDANLVKDWSIQNGIGFLSFWSIGRDNGDCPTGAISPYCSGISQTEYEFSKIFNEFNLV